MSIQNFPANPANGTIFELRPGLLYQYDAATNTWVQLISNDLILPLATPVTNGAMSAEDLAKLNRLVLPPPRSTLLGTDCSAPFRTGAITLTSGDEFIGVSGNVELRNLDETGEPISQTFPFQVQQHTYAYDFTLNFQKLVAELVKRGQLQYVGAPGEAGEDGDVGDPGDGQIFSGPPGPKGTQGSAPGCVLSVEPEPIQTQTIPNHQKALTRASIAVSGTNDSSYSVIFTRQEVGTPNAATSRFTLRQQKSSWMLCVVSVAAGAQPVYYVDVDPILSAIHDRYLIEVARLKKGYEDVVKYWIQTMSDLFDEQKSALCCALDFCMSKTKSTSMRQHMETVAASAAAGGAKILLHGRDSDAAVEISSTRLLADMPDGGDACSGGASFPQPQTAAPQTASAEVVVDPLIHTGVSNAVTLDLPSGNYTATITDTTAQINGDHFAPLAIQSAVGNRFKTAKFLDKGRHSSLVDGRAAYEGLTTSFAHSGGAVRAYFNMLPTPNTAGTTTLTITRGDTEPNVVAQAAPVPGQPEPDVNSCRMTTNKLRWYEKGWQTGNCCGCVINVGGQDYIVMKRSIGDERSCGGGESPATPCIESFKAIGHPAFAWPTLDGKSFVPLPNVDSVEYTFDARLNQLATERIAAGQYLSPQGNPPGLRHLAHQLTLILFPVT